MTKERLDGQHQRLDGPNPARSTLTNTLTDRPASGKVTSPELMSCRGLPQSWDWVSEWGIHTEILSSSSSWTVLHQESIMHAWARRGCSWRGNPCHVIAFYVNIFITLKPPVTPQRYCIVQRSNFSNFWLTNASLFLLWQIYAQRQWWGTSFAMCVTNSMWNRPFPTRDIHPASIYRRAIRFIVWSLSFFDMTTHWNGAG